MMSRKMTSIKQLTITTLLLCSSIGFAVEPMSEDALSDFALESGQSFIQIYGAPAAGLTVDIDENQANAAQDSKIETDDTTIESAAYSLKTIEEQITEQFKNANIEPVDPNLNAIVSSSEVIVGQANAFDQSSEITYRKKDFQHDAVFNPDGSVEHNRNLKIDLLKFENISNDDLNDNSTLGDIYISDWSSRGSTTTIIDE
jgi:hypothetical protein